MISAEDLLSKIPTIRPPDGVEPNFDDPYSQDHIPRIFTYVTTPPMIIFLILRLHTRIKVSGIGADDVLCVLGAASTIACIGVCFNVLDLVGGPHMWNVPVSKVTVDYIRKAVLLAPLFGTALMFVKVSILTFYRRIFQPSLTARVLIWIGIGFNIVYHVISAAIILTYCIPRKGDYPTGGRITIAYKDRCFQADGFVTAVIGFVGTAMDVYILLLPLGFLWGLNISSRRKAGLSGIFVLGSAACFCSIASIVFRMRIATAEYQDQDLTWNLMPIYATSIAEANIGIVCSCIPITFVLFSAASSWSGSWLTKLWLLTTSRRRKTSRADLSDIQLVNYQDIGQEELPRIPEGIMTGARTRVKNFSWGTTIETQPERSILHQQNDSYEQRD